VFLDGWFLTFKRIVDIYQKNWIFSSCFPCGILLRRTISCGVFITSGGGNSSELAVFHYSAQLNFWLLCRSFFLVAWELLCWSKLNCIAVSLDWSLKAVVYLHPSHILVCSNNMTVLLVTGAAQSWMQGIKELQSAHCRA
jgi:hypothetical protein